MTDVQRGVALLAEHALTAPVFEKTGGPSVAVTLVAVSRLVAIEDQSHDVRRVLFVELVLEIRRNDIVRRRHDIAQRADVSEVTLEFAWDTEMPEATQDVLEKLDRVFLPDEAERPLILHFDPSLDPIMELSLSGQGKRFEGEQGLRRLRRLAELQLKRELEPVKGVAAVRVRGGLEEEIHVLVDAASLRRTGLSIQQVIDRLAEENINVAGGTLQEGRTEYLVRTVNEFEDLGQIAETIVATFENRPVRIKDLGQVAYSHKEREILTRTDGGESVQIDKLGRGNIDQQGAFFHQSQSLSIDHDASRRPQSDMRG